jgi:predicted hydrocarbon binding protein
MGLNLEKGGSISCLEYSKESEDIGPMTEARMRLPSACSIGAIRSIILNGAEIVGWDIMARLVRSAGSEYSRLRAEQLLEDGVLEIGDIEKFLEITKEDFLNWGYGILTVKSISEDLIEVRVDESMSCSGSENIGKSLGFYEGGRITGGLSVIMGEQYRFEEVECWGLGDDHCTFKMSKLI